MTTWAVVPVKAIKAAKQRLSDTLSEGERGLLVRAMLADVLATLRGVPGLAGIAVVTSEPGITPPFARRIDDPGGDLNTAIGEASQTLAKIGSTAMLVVSADVPLATPGEIEAVLAAARDSAVVIVPDITGRGTNALLLSPPDRIAPVFGAHSRANHVAAARHSGIEPTVMQLPGLGFDVDGPAQLDRLRTLMGDRPAYRFLRPVAEATR